MTRIEQQIAEALGRYADYPLTRMNSETRVHHDAGLAGDDFDDFIAWFEESFGVALPGRFKDYAPGEPNLLDTLAWPFGRRRTYRELTIGDLARLASPGA